jgi:hypothetical protein
MSYVVCHTWSKLLAIAAGSGTSPVRLPGDDLVAHQTQPAIVRERCSFPVFPSHTRDGSSNTVFFSVLTRSGMTGFMPFSEASNAGRRTRAFGLNQASNGSKAALLMILTRCLDGQYSTPLLQIRYNEREICYKCATIAGEIGRPRWDMRVSRGEARWGGHRARERGCVHL